MRTRKDHWSRRESELKRWPMIYYFSEAICGGARKFQVNCDWHTHFFRRFSLRLFIALLQRRVPGAAGSWVNFRHESKSINEMWNSKCFHLDSISQRGFLCRRFSLFSIPCCPVSAPTLWERTHTHTHKCKVLCGDPSTIGPSLRTQFGG